MSNRYPNHYDPDNERYWYRIVNPISVDAQTRSLSKTALEFFAADLGFSKPYPEIQWVRPEPWKSAHDEVTRATLRQMDGQAYECDCFNEAGDFAGFTRFQGGNVITIRVGLNAIQLMRALADEVRHIWQDRVRGENYRENNFAEAEADAAKYSNDAVSRFSVGHELMNTLRDIGI